MSEQDIKNTPKEEHFKQLIKDQINAHEFNPQFTNEIMQNIHENAKRKQVPLLGRNALYFLLILIGICIGLAFIYSSNAPAAQTSGTSFKSLSDNGVMLLGAVGTIIFFLILDAFIRRRKKATFNS
jgi:cell division protein FtsW (lipid II flippase)